MRPLQMHSPDNLSIETDQRWVRDIAWLDVEELVLIRDRKHQEIQGILSPIAHEPTQRHHALVWTKSHLIQVLG